jgi:hypothetical protein
MNKREIPESVKNGVALIEAIASLCEDWTREDCPGDVREALTQAQALCQDLRTFLSSSPPIHLALDSSLIRSYGTITRFIESL